MKTAAKATVFWLLLASTAHAHIGSPDVYFDGHAGPYRLLTVVRMPAVIPGVAEIDVRVLEGGVRAVRVVPMRIRGPGAELAPTADLAEPAPGDPRLFRAQLWLMARGPWKLRIETDGDQGPAELSVPVVALSTMARPMRPPLTWILFAGMALLALGVVVIAGAAAREATSPPGAEPSPADQRRARAAMAGATAVVLAVLWLGNAWWGVEAASNSSRVYTTPHVSASLRPPRTLSLELQNPNAPRIRTGDLVPDHGHLMHLFLVREGALDRMLHLHPEQKSGTRFEQDLPASPAGRYRIFADTVRDNGFPETAIGEVTLPEIDAGAPTGDDSTATAAPLEPHPTTKTVAALGGGARMVWLRDPTALRASEPVWLRVRVEDAAGQPVTDLEPYMGMAAHLAVLRSDGGVFAHLHPSGSPPMATVELANGPNLMAHMAHTAVPAVPAEISFPYGFPQPGTYRLFVQVRRASRVETGVFDVFVTP